MKTLLILRHAKSSWKDRGVDDHDRTLNERGKRDAPRVGEVISEIQFIPELVFSSTAKRARKTAEAAALAFDFEGDIALDERLYLATPDELMAFLREIPEPCERAMIVGHNPGLEEFIAAILRTIIPMPTAALAVIELSIENWSDLSFDTEARLMQSWRPKQERAA